MDFNAFTIDEQVIRKYQEDEQLMVRLFVQWCTNHKLNPHELYLKAYPDQQENTVLQKVLKEMDDDEEIDIANETMLDILQLFENFELAFVVTEEIARQAQKE